MCVYLFSSPYVLMDSGVQSASITGFYLSGLIVYGSMQMKVTFFSIMYCLFPFPPPLDSVMIL